MAICSNCGAEVHEGNSFCSACGTAAQAGAAQGAPPPRQQPGQQQQAANQFTDQLNRLVQNTADHTDDMDPADIEKNKAMGGLAYILFFLPLVACPESKYGRFHANQGLVCLILGIAGSIARTIISAVLNVTIFLRFLAPVVSLVIWVPIAAVTILGLINGFNGKAKELPVIGSIRIIK